MNFQIIPAIDIISGKCVRLRQGRVEDMTVFSEDPVLVAKRWEQLGADAIHVVDLDGAFKGVPVNFHIIERMASEVAVPIQVGGGVRTLEIASRYFDAGVGKVILGTTIVRDRKSIFKITKEYGDSVIAAIDATKGKVAIRGWVEVTGISAIDLACDLESVGISSFIYTDISRDGMLEGPDYGSIETFATSVKGRVIASGGITAVGDILKIREISLKKAEKRITGVIVGRALYSSRIDFREARMALKGKGC